MFRVLGTSNLETGENAVDENGHVAFLPSRTVVLGQLFRVSDREQTRLLWVRKWKFQSTKIWGLGDSPYNVVSSTFR